MIAGLGIGLALNLLLFWAMRAQALRKNWVGFGVAFAVTVAIDVSAVYWLPEVAPDNEANKNLVTGFMIGVFAALVPQRPVPSPLRCRGA